VVKGCFCGGFYKNRCTERGFLMVRTWWNDGKTW
jgi:hypothetical protein